LSRAAHTFVLQETGFGIADQYRALGSAIESRLLHGRDDVFDVLASHEDIGRV
jgi:hypothetical protein